MNNLTDSFTLISAAVDSRGAMFLLATCDEVQRDKQEHTCGFLIENEVIVDKLIFRWEASGVVNIGDHSFLILGSLGEYYIYDAGTVSKGVIWHKAPSPYSYGVMRKGGAFKGEAWWVGLEGRCAHLSATQEWTQVTVGLEGDFEGVIVWPNKSVVAFGWHGNLAALNGATWKRIDVPTNMTLTNGCPTPDGQGLIVGLAGVILKGFGDTWQTVAEDETDQDLWGVASFESTVFVSSERFLYELTPDAELKPVEFADGLPETCFNLVTSPDGVWLIGNKSLFAFASGKWRIVEIPDPT